MAVQPVYHVWPKQAYDVDLLISDETRLFAQSIRSDLLPEEKYDLDQAGKCLAFEVPTAAAFHIFRATESVMRRYYAVVVGTLPKLKMRNWSVYIKNRRHAGADQKVLSALEQVKDLHRNPVIHPETQMDQEEALSLVGMMESVISAMFADMRRREEAVTPPAIPGRNQLAGLSQGRSAGLRGRRSREG